MSSIRLLHISAGLLLFDSCIAKNVYVPYSILAYRTAYSILTEPKAINVYANYPFFEENVWFSSTGPKPHTEDIPF